jgi:hypothetical protein
MMKVRFGPFMSKVPPIEARVAKLRAFGGGTVRPVQRHQINSEQWR